MTARGLEHKVTRVERGEVIGNVHELPFRDPTRFRKMLQNDALKWRLKLMSWIGLDIKFLFFRFFNILRVTLKVCTTILNATP